MSSPHSSARLSYQPELDGLRALCILPVIAHHVPEWKPYHLAGFLGVDLFFVLSGALITRLLLAELDATSSLSLRTFYSRRARRLYPALLAMLLAVVLVVALTLPGRLLAPTARDAAYSALYLGAWIAPHRAIPFFGHTWSLSLEELFYLGWPLLLLALARSGRRAIGLVLALLVLAPVAWRIHLWFDQGVPSRQIYFSPDTRLDTLAMGALAGLVVHVGAAERARGLLRVLAPLAALGLLALMAHDQRQETWYVVLGYSLSGALSALVVAGQMVAPSRVLRWRPLVWLGKLSYSLYLWHLPALTLGLAWGARTGPSLAAGAVLAVMSFRWIETPLRAR